MSELPPDIPPWSPLADRGRVGDGRVDGGRGDGAGTDPSSAPGTLLTREDDEPALGPAPEGPTPRRRPVLRLGLAAAAVLALLTSVLVLARPFGGSDPEPPPTTTVRAPLPTTSPAGPAPIGTRVELGNGWTVVVDGFDPAPTPRPGLLAPQSPPLEDGRIAVLVDLEMSYVDGVPDAESPFLGVDLSVRDADGNVTTPADGPCTAGEPALDLATELERGRSASGRICFAVDAAQAEDLVLVAAPSMTLGATPSYLALQPVE